MRASAQDGPGRTGVKNADSMEGSVLNEVPMDAWIQVRYAPYQMPSKPRVYLYMSIIPPSGSR